MKFRIYSPCEPAQALRNLKVFAAGLVIGCLGILLVCFVESHANVRRLGIPLGLVVFWFPVCILALTVPVAREPSLRRLAWVGLVTVVTPWCLLLVLQLFTVAGHDMAMLDSITYLWSCTISGLSLLVLAGIRSLRERRKSKIRG